MRERLTAYYAERALEYERVYEKPERQADLASLRELVPGYFRGRRVLEVACGTGYWTALIARSAASIVATDAGAEVIQVAKGKGLASNTPVEFHLADAFNLTPVPGEFDAAFAGFWWSHVPREELPRFLRGLNSRLRAGARVMLLDNRYVAGSSTVISRADPAGNTYQLRSLENGVQYEILKNFPSAAEVRDCLVANGGHSADVTELPYYWYATYVVRAA